MSQRTIHLTERIAGALRNGSKLESASIAIHDRLARETAVPEFRERLALAHADEERHARIQRELADHLWDGPLPTGEGIRRMIYRGLEEPLAWTMTALTITEQVFQYRLIALARRCRQIGLRTCYDPLLEIAQDEGRHVQLVRDMIRAQLQRPSPEQIADVSRWLAANEHADTSGLFPADQLVPLMTHRLIQELA